MMKISLSFLAAALIVVSGAIPALAVTSTIGGVVTDADGRPVQGAIVTLFDADRAEVTSVDTGADGRFVFNSVRLNTDLFTIRVFYTDRHQSYTNIAYLTKWYPSKNEITINQKDTRLEGYHKSTPTPSSAGLSAGLPLPVSTPGLSIISTAFSITLAVTISLMLSRKL